MDADTIAYLAAVGMVSLAIICATIGWCAWLKSGGDDHD